MLNILFVADNRDGRNIGCRGSSIALKDILSEKFMVKDIITREEKLAFHSGINLSWYTEENIKLISSHNYDKYQEIVTRIKRVDMVVINGEGSFIFKTNYPRIEMLNFLVYCRICIQYNIPFFIVNTIFSASSDEESNGLQQNDLNLVTLDETIKIFRFAQLITVRDMQSYNLIKSYDMNNSINIKYIPDALFTWFDFYNNKINIKNLDYILKYPNFSLSHDCHENVLPKFDFNHEYVLFSGTSFSGTSQDNNLSGKKFVSLANELKKMLSLYNTRLYLLEACDGDSAFRSIIPKETGIPYIPVTTNIFLLGRLLGRCLCYVSGRYHPSILASLGGASCVFMGSNSHKTTSLQAVLNYPDKERQTFQAYPDDDEINNIVLKVQNIVEKRKDRNFIKKVCETNSDIAKRLPDLMIDCLKRKCFYNNNEISGFFDSIQDGNAETLFLRPE